MSNDDNAVMADSDKQNEVIIDAQFLNQLPGIGVPGSLFYDETPRSQTNGADWLAWFHVCPDAALLHPVLCEIKNSKIQMNT